MNTQHPKKFRVMLLGDSGVGKTSFIRRFRDNLFDESNTPIPTDDSDMIKVKTTHQVDGAPVELHLWDHACSKKFMERGMSRPYRTMHAGIIFFEVGLDQEPAESAFKSSFRNAYLWAQDLERYAQHGILPLLVGTKSDQLPDLDRMRRHASSGESVAPKGVNSSMPKSEIKKWKKIAKARTKELCAPSSVSAQDLPGIMNLPDFVLRKILRYLTYRDVSRCAAVNFNLFRFMEDDKAWEEAYCTTWPNPKLSGSGQTWRRKIAEKLKSLPYVPSLSKGLMTGIQELSEKIFCNYAFASSKTGKGVQEIVDYVTSSLIAPDWLRDSGRDILVSKPLISLPRISSKHKAKPDPPFISSPPWWQCQVFFQPRSGRFSKPKNWVIGRYMVSKEHTLNIAVSEVPFATKGYSFAANVNDFTSSMCSPELPRPPASLCGHTPVVAVLLKTKDTEIIFYAYQKDANIILTGHF